MADYPNAVYDPRLKENKPGVEYDPSKSTVGFAEDVTKLDAEVVAIETELGANPKGAYASVAAFLAALLSAVGGIVTDFLGLSDTPASYAAQAGLFLKVNAAENALEFGEAGAAVGGLYGINVETLAADKTLTPGTDKIYQYLDEGGANRIITLNTASASAGDRFVIRHNGTAGDVNYFDIKQGATILDKIYAVGIKEFIFDGTNWISNSIGTGSGADSKIDICIGYYAKGGGFGTAIGYSSNGYNGGVSVGPFSNASNSGVAIGREADANIEGVAIGRYARGNNNCVALGFYTNTNQKKYSVALGHYSKNERFSEIAHNINGVDADQENNLMTIGLEKETANNTPIEMLCGGQAAQRITIRPSSVLVFTILVTARDNVSGDCAAYKVEGAIKRDAAGNTVMLAAAVVSVIHEDDASWDVAVAADDVNEALVITVTGDAINITQWAARLDGVETHF